MRHKRVLSLVSALFIASMAMAGRPAGAQFFTVADWLLHRGNPQRQGHNGDLGTPAGENLDRAWVFPATADMPGEIVVDNGVPPVANFAYNLATGQAFTTAGNWVYSPTTPGGPSLPTQSPDFSSRGAGAWPVTFPQGQPGKQGDYLFTDTQHSDTLALIVQQIGGVDQASLLPNLGNDLPDPQPGGQTFYQRIHNELVTNGTTFARWTFGTQYPAGTRQGARDVSLQGLTANQRYAVYIRFPSSSTTVNGVAHPNTDHVMVRVSWGANPDDPIRSRIFILNFGQTGGFWLRVRSGAKEDRYFPYDGVNPITVTLYALTPDAVNNGTTTTIVPADAVRLVPEALRGDIHAAAASAVFPPGTDPNVTNGSVKRTYFGRDETAGPRSLFPKITDFTNGKASADSGFLTIPFDPSKPPQSDSTKANFNPIIADPSSSIRSAVFYCMEDDIVNRRFGRLVWRYVARNTAVQTTTVDDAEPPNPPAFTLTGPDWLAQTGDDSFNNGYHTATSQNAANDSAVWQAPLPEPVTGAANVTYSVFVWIPAGQTLNFATHAHYIISTDQGDVDYFLDQHNTGQGAMTPKFGMWRQLAAGIRFPAGTFNGNAVPALGKVTLQNDGTAADVAANRVVAADTVQFVAESRSVNTVFAAPLIARVKWPSGTVRSVVYFATTDGHVYALDAIGAGNNSTLTTAFWVYPSISNPQTGTFAGIQDDPNYAQFQTGGNTQGIDGEWSKNQNTGAITPVNTVPALGGFISSPMYVEVEKSAAPLVRVPFIIIGNQNGRIYGFDPTGRVDPATNDPFAATAAAGDNPGIPGTTKRTLTWPTLARDKWIASGGAKSIGSFTNDPAKGYFSASPTAKIDTATTNPDTGAPRTDRIISGSGDGHVYAVDLQTVDPNQRMSNPLNNGAPLWQFPEANRQLDPINLPGALSTGNDKFTFSAGGRVYGIATPPAQANGKLRPEWVFPFTANPPGNQNNTSDKPPIETPFTAPVWITGENAINGGKDTVFAANQDGRVFAFDATQTNGQEPNLLWTDIIDTTNLAKPSPSRSFGTTRASVVFLHSLTHMPGFRYPTSPLGSGPALLLPLDTGAMIGLAIIDTLQTADGSTQGGKLIWNMPDATGIGGVPLVDPNGNTSAFPTNNAWRGADATTASAWVYEGDEGDPNTGEMNGQMRAYASTVTTGGGIVTGGEPDINFNRTVVDIRLVDLWNSQADTPPGPWDFFGDQNPGRARSPFNELNNVKTPTQSGMVVFEWGDRINVAAWGAYSSAPGSVLPTITFTLRGPTSSDSQTVGSAPDVAYSGVPLIMRDPDGTPHPGQPWVAKYSFQLGRGSERNPQTPGTRYTVTAVAQLPTGGGVGGPSVSLSVGQRRLANPPPNPPADINDVSANGQPRPMVMAHPLALTTRGTQPDVQMLNIIGWTDNAPTDNATTNLGELLANGNGTVSTASFGFTGYKDVVAPLGLVSHGTTGTYLGMDANGKRVSALFVADRSNMYKLNQPINNVKVDRRELRWAFNPNLAGVRLATGDVMNPLPWETFPSSVPNISLDYPDMDRNRTTVKGNDLDLTQHGVTLPTAQIVSGNKKLVPLELTLQVDVPKFQPANVNTFYADINGNPTPANQPGLLAPMVVSTGQDPRANNNLRATVQPSGGYIGQVAVYIDSNGTNTFQATSTVAVQGGVPTTREDVYRQLNVGVGIPPDIKMRTEEDTIDLGTAPHSMGYTPYTMNPPLPYAPSGMGPYDGVGPIASLISPWNTMGGPGFFRPFTVRNLSNVNLRDLRVAKIVGDPTATGPNAVPRPWNEKDPFFWVRLTSDQVDPTASVLLTPPIFALPLSILNGQGGAGNLGVITSLDHFRDPAFGPADQLEFNYNKAYNTDNFWPLNPASPPRANPYIQANNMLGWNAGQQPTPTLHKPRPGDAAPTTMSVPDVAYGDPLQFLLAVRTGNPANNIPPTEVRPQVGVAVPFGTPVGVYSVKLTTFEDGYPQQWRDWNDIYRQITGTTNVKTAMDISRDHDGVLNVQFNSATGQPIPAEGVSDPPFTLKVTVRESRLTNGVTPGSFPQIDIRRPDNQPYGANIQPQAMRDVATGNIFLYWASNRPDNLGPAPTAPDTPWYLFYSQVADVFGQVQLANAPYNVYDWKFEPNGTRWWSPVSVRFPSIIAPRNLFPRDSGDIPNGATSPTVPGNISDNTERHATPALTQDDDPANQNPTTYLFWQGVVYKTSGISQNPESFVADTRTFYLPLKNGQPDLGGNGGLPYSFLNDPLLPKFGPKPLAITDLNGKHLAFLFWFGGGQGRTKLYYNSNVAANAPLDVKQWSRDIVLPTPGALITLSDPTPIHRRVWTTWFNPKGEFIDAIDVVYSGTLRNRRSAETFMTRYALDYPRDANGVINGAATGRLVVMPMGAQDVAPNGQTDTPGAVWDPTVNTDLLVREGTTQTWTSRDVAWVYAANHRDPANPSRLIRDYLDATGRPYFIISVNGIPVNGYDTVNHRFKKPTYDPATGYLHFDSAMGGEVVVDPQLGSVTFTSVAPRPTDRVTAAYTPQSLRMNVTRNDSGALLYDYSKLPGAAPTPLLTANWLNDAGFQPRPHVPAPGSNTGPVAFIDRFQNADQSNPRRKTILPQLKNGDPMPPVTRMWVLYRKTDSSVTSPAGIYYKTMRLLVRLPRGVLLDQNGLATTNVQVVGNRGPVEVDWVRGRLYFTEIDEGNNVTVTFNYARDNNGNAQSMTAAYRVEWGDEISTALTPGDQTTLESMMPTQAAVNEGQISAFKDPFQDKVWVFWVSTRDGTSDLYSTVLAPQFYSIPQ